VKRRDVLARGQSQPGGGGSLDHGLRIDPVAGSGTGPATPGFEVDDADAPLRFQRERDLPEQRHRIFHFTIHVCDEHGVEAGRQVRVGGGPEHRADVPQVLALHAAGDRFDHLPLNVLGIDDAVRADAAREVHREPAPGRADFRDDGALGDEERVHDLIRLLPLLAIGRFEEPQVERIEQVAVRPGLVRRSRRDRPRSRRLQIGGVRVCQSRRQKTQDDSSGCPAHPAQRSGVPHAGPFGPATCVCHPPAPPFSVPFSPTMPPRVIASTERISSRRAPSRSPRSSTMSRIARPLLTASFAISAVAA
jgi:hypothetical protein